MLSAAAQVEPPNGVERRAKRGAVSGLAPAIVATSIICYSRYIKRSAKGLRLMPQGKRSHQDALALFIVR